MLTAAPILALYDPNKETKVNADALSYGIGSVVMQQQENGDWKPISLCFESVVTGGIPVLTSWKRMLGTCLGLRTIKLYDLGKIYYWWNQLQAFSTHVHNTQPRPTTTQNTKVKNEADEI